MSELRGRLTFVEKVNTKLKRTLKTRNRCKVKLKKKHIGKLKLQMAVSAAASYQIFN